MVNVGTYTSSLNPRGLIDTENLASPKSRGGTQKKIMIKNDVCNIAHTSTRIFIAKSKVKAGMRFL